MEGVVRCSKGLLVSGMGVSPVGVLLVVSLVLDGFVNLDFCPKTCLAGSCCDSEGAWSGAFVLNPASVACFSG